jgi:hypothetical protein
MLQEVRNHKQAKDFLELPRKLYKDDPKWICPLDSDIAAIFDPSINPFFQTGECIRWVLYNDSNEVIGRISAFLNGQIAEQNDEETGGMGFFECINDFDAAKVLFDVARNWLRDKGMKVMLGPVNFGENDRYWGLLIEGAESPSFGMNYNPPYYLDFFEKYGFKKKYDQFTNFLDLTVPFPARFTKIADWVMNKPGYNFKYFEPKNKEKFFNDFQEIYNDAWQAFDHFHPIDVAIIRESFRQMKPILDKKIVWFAYHEDEPIAFVVCMPDVNQILKYFNGKMNLWNKLRFLWIKKTKTNHQLRIIAMGCKQKYQNRGIESALIRCLEIEVVPRNTITHVELAWVADFNHKMIAIHEATGAKRYKVHRTYEMNVD